MIAFALFPLGIYFLCLASFYRRSTPTVLNGSTDVWLLAFGLFGLITLGPGRLLIPLPVLSYWNLFAWIFWASLYFVLAHFLAEHSRGRTVVYRCSMNRLIHELQEFFKEHGSVLHLEKQVLNLPEYDIQSTLRCGFSDSYVQFQSTESNPDRLTWLRFESDLRRLCQNVHLTSRSPVFLLHALSAFGMIVGSGILLYFEWPAIVRLFFDYWV